MNAYEYVNYGMQQRFYAWYVKDCTEGLEAAYIRRFKDKIKEELLGLNWLTK